MTRWRERRKLAVLGGLLLGLMAGGRALSYERQSEAAALVAAGRRVYDDRQCATCHMIAGQGNRRFPLDGVARRLSEADLERWLTATDEMERALPQQPAIRMSEWLDDQRAINAKDRAALVAFLATLR